MLNSKYRTGEHQDLLVWSRGGAVDPVRYPRGSLEQSVKTPGGNELSVLYPLSGFEVSVGFVFLEVVSIMRRRWPSVSEGPICFGLGVTLGRYRLPWGVCFYTCKMGVEWK